MSAAKTCVASTALRKLRSNTQRRASAGRLKKLRSGVVVASLLGAGGIVAAYFVDFASTFRAHRELRTYIAPVNVFAGLRGYYSKTHKVAKLVVSPYGDDAHRAHPGGRPRLFVFVLGETARARRGTYDVAASPII